MQGLGLLVTFHFFVKFSFSAWLYIRHSSIHRYLKDTRGAEESNWALVIGAVDGIRQAFAGELCQRGFNIILHGSNTLKLDCVSTPDSLSGGD